MAPIRPLHRFRFVAIVVFMASSVPGIRAAQGTRTDINPALLYLQAQAAIPKLTDAEHGHVFTNEWRGRPLDPAFGEIMSRYNPSFRLLRRASRQAAPCEWGYDVSEGPELELPSLARAKSLAQAARLRLRWQLEQGERDGARDDFLATFALARQVSRDGILISALVQFAMENILTGALADNWHRLDTGTLGGIVAGIEASPSRGTVGQCIPAERMAFRDWLVRNIEEARARATNEGEVLGVVNGMMKRLSHDDPTLAGRIVEAAGGTSEGVLRYIREVDPLYTEAEALMRLSYSEFVPAIKAFNERVAAHPNLLVHVFFPLFENCRFKEFAVDVKTDMIRAALEYRKLGTTGLTAVPDPTDGKPFEFRRFLLSGADRGFELRSRMDARGWVESLIFVESDGRPFQIEGKYVGQPPK